ncbi:GNAT family N-acetyltransferase [Cohnella rhizosphaerae]|uniref:GNAT family N-acetyltransferase n=1 Tax=Cohnella rhizosphaerae TaxID=1457232 RepID=A0A9X4KY79_9BACL|nr:GNAT family N-acetyltransferase [Cohnella rhizosphaerae]MDG0812928.1 GNAT family N-acetyltransferase [Cohnella rhizosphaerae]
MAIVELAVRRIDTREAADAVVAFLVSPQAFDDERPTPGEEEHFRTLPYLALEGKTIYWYMTDGAGEVVAVTGVAPNEQRTGGYTWDYLVVRRDYRRGGAALRLAGAMLDYLRGQGARYLVTYTCDLPVYAGVRRLFDRLGFSMNGRLPDYYFEGEDRLIYYLDLRTSGRSETQQ